MVMYIRKSVADFLSKMPIEMKIPKNFKKLVKEKDVEYNLLIKHGSEYECTNCGKYFHSEQVEGCSDICPFCDNQYDVRRSNLKNYFFFYDLALIDNIDNKVVIRYFEIRRKYDNQMRRFKDSIVEYARIVPELDIELANDRFVKYMSVEKIYHTKRIKRWRIFTGQYGLAQHYQAVYLENMNEKLKGTIYEYSQIKEAIEYLNNSRIDLESIFKKAKCPSFELLMKLGLYKLALDCPEKFNAPGSFEKRFGVKKDYLKFMKKNNIEYRELQVLRLIDRPNIKIIRRLIEMSRYYTDDLEKINKYVKLVKVYEYSKGKKDFYLSNYLDYLENIEKLGIPFTRKILFPEDFNEAHDESVKKVKIVNNKIINSKMKERYKELANNQFNNGIYFIRPAKNLKDIKDEAKQQNNCVYTNYSEKYAKGDTDIYFMRNTKNPEKSLVTVEVLNNKIRQKYQKGNKIVTDKQDAFLKLWEKQIIQKVA